jgi:hypothetical protein
MVAAALDGRVLLLLVVAASARLEPDRDRFKSEVESCRCKWLANSAQTASLITSDNLIMRRISCFFWLEWEQSCLACDTSSSQPSLACDTSSSQPSLQTTCVPSWERENLRLLRCRHRDRACGSDPG